MWSAALPIILQNFAKNSLSGGGPKNRFYPMALCAASLSPVKEIVLLERLFWYEQLLRKFYSRYNYLPLYGIAGEESCSLRSKRFRRVFPAAFRGVFRLRKRLLRRLRVMSQNLSFYLPGALSNPSKDKTTVRICFHSLEHYLLY